MTRFAPVLLVLASACDIGSTHSTPNVEEPNAARGQVSGQAEQGSSLTAFRVETDGSLTAMSPSTQADAAGQYRLDVVLDDEPTQRATDFIVQATSEAGDATQVLVSATLSANGEVHAAPITNETTMEARTWRTLVSDDATASTGVTTAFVRSAISAETAAQAQMDTNPQISVDALADGIIATMVSLQPSSSTLQLLTELQVDADTTGNSEPVLANAAWDDESTLDSVALHLHTASEATHTIATQTSEDNDGAIQRFVAELEGLRAEASGEVGSAASIPLGLSASGAAAIDQAGDDLVTGVLDTTLVVGDLLVSEEWSAWSIELSAVFAAELSTESWLAVEAATTAAAEAEATLETQLEDAAETYTTAEAHAVAVAEAMDTFQATIEADYRVESLSRTDLGPDGAQAMVRVLQQVHASVD